MSLSAGGGGSSYPQSPFTSPEDLMKNLPKAMSNMFGAGGGMPGDSPNLSQDNSRYLDKLYSRRRKNHHRKVLEYGFFCNV